jgi:hypothetical protein
LYLIHERKRGGEEENEQEEETEEKRDITKKILNKFQFTRKPGLEKWTETRKARNKHRTFSPDLSPPKQRQFNEHNIPVHCCLSAMDKGMPQLYYFSLWLETQCCDCCCIPPPEEIL